MRTMLVSNHFKDADGVPAGGTTFGQGFAIGWQNGPLGRGSERLAPNGAFVEDVIIAARSRLLHYQNSRFSCPENQDAINHLTCALEALNSRTDRRDLAGTEGTHSGT